MPHREVRLDRNVEEGTIRLQVPVPNQPELFYLVIIQPRHTNHSLFGAGEYLRINITRHSVKHPNAIQHPMAAGMHNRSYFIQFADKDSP